MRSIRRCLLMLAAQAAIIFVLSFAFALARPVKALFSALMYGGLPILSAVSAALLVIKGMNPYLSWLLPPAAVAASGFLASMGYAPSFLPVLITAFVSLVGAATGDTVNKTRKRR